MNRELTYDKWIKYIHNYQLNKNKKMREVKISSRTIYHKYCEIIIEIPKDIAEDKVSDWLFENEDKWTDAIENANNQATLEYGFGLGDGMDEKDSEHEMRFDIDEENYGGHL